MTIKQTVRRSFYSLLLGLTIAFGLVSAVHAQLGSQQNPQSDLTGLQGTIPSPAPTTAATISLPVNGRTFTATPITVSGLCSTGLLVKVFSNNIFIGSVQCANGSFSLQVDLFSGQNDIVARVYDALDQAGPDSNTVSVTFENAQFAAFGQRVTMTSKYAKRGANPGSQLTWPIILSGGTGPYALSIDWGDGTAASLKSVPFPGSVDITHVYQSAGVYRVIVKATDVNGQVAFLQLVGVANGQVTQDGTAATSAGGNTVTKTVFVWWPFAVLFVLIILAFWLGTRYELQAIHRQIEKQTEFYNRDS
jgi:hypothetical protein